MRKLALSSFILIAYLIFRPILGDVWYPTHDSTGIARAYLLEKSLLRSGFPAVWADELNDGQGYPLFHFYAPLMTYLTLLGKTLTSSYFAGIKAVLFLTSVIGMVGVYVLTRYRGRLSALLTSISFALFPYAAVNLYVRGAYSEYLSIALLPWLFYVWRDLSTTRRKLIAALFTTLFLLSHNLIPLITLPFLLVWLFIHHSLNFKLLALPIIITILLSSFYLFPLLFERHFVQADLVARTTNYTKHFVAPTQLWNSLWGYGGSGEGIEDGMSFKVGKLQFLLSVVATLVIIVKKKFRELFWVISLVFAIFMTTNYSSFLWQNLSFLQVVQFPWRYLALVGFFSSILVGYPLTLIKALPLQVMVFSFLLALTSNLNLKFFVPQTIYPAKLSDFTSESYLSTIPTIIPEYRPVWLDLKNSLPEGTQTLPYHYYPTWQVLLDGQKVNPYPGEGGLLAFANPEGSQNIVVKQSHTILETFSTILSLITLIVVVKLYVKN